MPRRKKKVSRLPLFVLIILILLSILSLAIINLIDTSKYFVVNVLTVSGTTIIVGHNCTAILAETSPERAYSIELGMKGIIEERPNTHDTFAEVLKSFNVTLESIQIERFDGRYYYADLLLKSGDKILKIDTKPSDAIALALRTNSTIYISKALLKEMGRDIC